MPSHSPSILAGMSPYDQEMFAIDQLMGIVPSPHGVPLTSPGAISVSPSPVTTRAPPSAAPPDQAAPPPDQAAPSSASAADLSTGAADQPRASTPKGSDLHAFYRRPRLWFIQDQEQGEQGKVQETKTHQVLTSVIHDDTWRTRKKVTRGYLTVPTLQSSPATRRRQQSTG